MATRKTILFLEDEEELLSTVGMLLRDQGYDVLDATRGEDALKIVQQATPDLIIADIKLPGMDGFDFFKEVRKIKNCKNVPFVYVTAFNNLKAAGVAKKEGAAEYITKPFDFEYLVARVKALAPP